MLLCPEFFPGAVVFSIFVSPYTSNCVQFEYEEPPKQSTFETPVQRKERLKKEAAEANTQKIEEQTASCGLCCLCCSHLRSYFRISGDPKSDSKATENAYNTLFVARLSFETTEGKLQREFERFGPVKSVRVVRDLEGMRLSDTIVDVLLMTSSSTLQARAVATDSWSSSPKKP